MANDIPGGASGAGRGGVWGVDWTGGAGTPSIDVSKLGFPDANSNSVGSDPGYMHDILSAAANPNIQINSSSLGGSVPFPPTTENGTHPMGSLQVKDGVITTAGGYKIEQLGQFTWQITGQDGKTTKIWGDPHVEEGDGGKWDFKKNSTFVLGDGTQIHVKTTPYGNGATVTGSLEVVSGNDHVSVTDIDKGKGKVGDLQHDGYSLAGHLEDDVFVMGNETDDWALGKGGKEIIGSESQGEKFKTGDDLMTGYADWNTQENRFMKGFHGYADPLDSKEFLDHLDLWAKNGNGGTGLVGNNGKGAKQTATVDSGTVTNHDGKSGTGDAAERFRSELAALFTNLAHLFEPPKNENDSLRNRFDESFRFLKSALDILSEMRNLSDEAAKRRTF